MPCKQLQPELKRLGAMWECLDEFVQHYSLPESLGMISRHIDMITPARADEAPFPGDEVHYGANEAIFQWLASAQGRRSHSPVAYFSPLGMEPFGSVRHHANQHSVSWPC